jgi:hypothetical protein
MKRSFFRMLVSLLFISAFISLYLQPTAQIPFADSILIIFAVQLASVMVGNRYGGSTNTAHLVRIVFMAAVTAAVTELLLKPSVPIAFDSVFLGLCVIEMGALFFARAVVSK